MSQEKVRLCIGTVLRIVALPRWTVLFFLLIAVASLGVVKLGWPATQAMIVPFVILVLNLGAAIATLPRFRRDFPLLLFHLTLLLLIALFIVGRLTYFSGTTALTRGEIFEGSLIVDERGPLHGDGLRGLVFENLGFSETNTPKGGYYNRVINRVRWYENGRWRTREIGDDNPLVVGNYRIYTSSRRGFTPVFSWQPLKGEVVLGQVQLNPIIEGEVPPVNNWHLPDGTEVWTMLAAIQAGNDSFIPDVTGESNTDLNSDRLDHALVLRIGEERHEIRIGDDIELAGGTLTYKRLGSWMGYRLVYDPTHPWLIATIAIGLLSLIWFYIRQLSAKNGWDSDR